MVYLDTGCLLKLYYPESESEAVAAAVIGEAIVSNRHCMGWKASRRCS